MKTIKLTTESGEELEIYEDYYKILKEHSFKKDSRWLPEKDSGYFYLNSSNLICSAFWKRYRFGTYRLNTNNVFKTEEEAAKEQKKRQALADVTQYCHENDLVLVDVDWNDKLNARYDIVYDSCVEKFMSSLLFTDIALNQLPYLKSGEACEQVIKNCEAELLTVFNIKK